MKKTLVWIWALFLGPMLFAGPVSPGRALEIGRRILEGPSTRGNSSEVHILWDGEFKDGVLGDHPAFFVIGRDTGGFVIIAGNDNAMPVLAISENGRFESDRMPDNVRWWMERMKTYVRSRMIQTGLVRARWAALQGTRADDWSLDSEAVTQKEGHPTPEWDQGNKDLVLFGQNIFNAFCPRDRTGALSVTGCVATSIAEVMTTLSAIYPEAMPATSTGTISAYSVPNNYVAAATRNAPYHLGTTVFDWEGLRTLRNTDAIREALNEGKTVLLENLGRLMADCGAIMQAQYSSEGTGAVSEYIPSYMSSHFYMSKNAHVEKADNYTSAQWTRMLKEELIRHPVLYSGRTTDGAHGHAFVFDGFGRLEDDIVFHVNFGWRSLCNGYYRFDFLKTDEDGETGQDEIWERDCDAIFSFVPDKNQVTVSAPSLKLFSSSSFTGLSVSSPISSGASFSPAVGSIRNIGSANYSGKLRGYLRKKDGTLTQIGETSLSLNAGSSWNTSSGSGWGGGWWGGGWGNGNQLSCTIPSGTEIGFGDCIALYYTSGADIIPVSYDEDGTIHGTIPLVPAAFIRTEESYHVNDSFCFQLINYDALYAGTVWTITEPDGNRIRIKQSFESYRLTQTGKYRVEAAIAPSEGADTVEHLVTFITVE